MVQLSDPDLDLVFAALADRTRRDVLIALGQRDLSISELAQPHAMSLTGFMKHLRVLEAAGLIARSKEGRVVRCELSAAPLQEAAVWLSRYEKFWNARLDALGRYLHNQEETTSCPTPMAPTSPPPPANAPNSASNATTPSRPKKSGARGPTRKR
ncbi:metalloregulator ArsR/SmtB family transcription factor [Variovorax sp. dw_954]|uniref:ArsR/SmtB family transcription factor n=1 Tax=Variovorax sp. dw_954 TaxID=2720078 RepID=UPI001BD3A72F|nr:metalloregulator ArsR/SmtB family transcription factor [Variovorax sp. dw_954]